MPNVLALEASSQMCSVALWANEQMYHRIAESPRSHSQHLLPLVEELVRDADISLSDVDAIAFSEGPGSFTGLRIGLSIAQGLAFGIGIPLVPVSTLAGLAMTALESTAVKEVLDKSVVEEFPLFAVLDARMEELFLSGYVMNRQGIVREILPPSVLTYSDASEKIQLTREQQALEDAIFVGSGVQYLDGDIQTQMFPQIEPDAAGLLFLGREAFQAGKIVEPHEAESVYLRNSVAWNKRTRIRSTSL